MEPVHLHQPLFGCAGTGYSSLLQLVRGKDYFVLTTNVDHCFQKAGLTSCGCSTPKAITGFGSALSPAMQRPTATERLFKKWWSRRGFGPACPARWHCPKGKAVSMAVPTELVPHCPVCGAPMCMNLRVDERFVEDEGFHAAAGRYQAFLHRQKGRRVLYLELGVGRQHPWHREISFLEDDGGKSQAVYACVNREEADVPARIAERSICIRGDAGRVLSALR